MGNIIFVRGWRGTFTINQAAEIRSAGHHGTRASMTEGPGTRSSTTDRASTRSNTTARPGARANEAKKPGTRVDTIDCLDKSSLGPPSILALVPYKDTWQEDGVFQRFVAVIFGLFFISRRVLRILWSFLTLFCSLGKILANVTLYSILGSRRSVRPRTRASL